MEGDIRAVHVLISGRVQGVAYRAWTERHASALGLSGWVRNVAGGQVEAVFSGPSAAVEAMLAACHQGPDYAWVERVEVLGRAEPVAGAFTIRTDR